MCVRIHSVLLMTRFHAKERERERERERGGGLIDIMYCLRYTSILHSA